MRIVTIFIISILSVYSVIGQVEHVPLANPVYQFLVRAESRGYLEHGSLAVLPLQKKEITRILKQMFDDRAELSDWEKEALERYMLEFDMIQNQDAVLFDSETDSLSLFSMNFFDKDKSIYRYDSTHTVNLDPLVSFDYRYDIQDGEARNVLLANAGFRLNGTLSGHLGYFLQATNGSSFAGDRELALEDPRLSQNVKFNDLESDFDFTESHIRFDYDWFYAYIGRETRQWGPGLINNMIINSSIPPMDQLSLGARFEKFEYRFTQGSLLSYPIGLTPNGFTSEYIDKYFVHHRAALRPSWGEIALWETVIYSDRNWDLGYWNPLSFLKSVEHSLRDRDNSIMGLDATIRPFEDWQIKGSFLLDDLVFSELGTDYWSNKWAWNLVVFNSSIDNIDLGLEYSLTKPYTFTHFARKDNYTHDQYQIGSSIPPNSHQIAGSMNFWWGERYPVSVAVTYTEHGANIIDSDTLVRNVGGSPRYGHRGTILDDYYAPFLDGNLEQTLNIDISAGYEVFRNFSILGFISYIDASGLEFTDKVTARLLFRYEDF
jgi:hypothetical protein